MKHIMTKEELEQVDSWKHALPTKEANTSNKEIEFDVISGVDSIPRVQYLRSLGYNITNLTEYAYAEINEMGRK